MFWIGLFIGLLAGVVLININQHVLAEDLANRIKKAIDQEKAFTPDYDESLSMYKAPDSCPNCKSIKIHIKLEPERPLIYYCIDCGWELNAKTGEVKESAKVTEEDNLIDRNHG
jgi:Zn ribbon nucleic-acid-binding protein